MARMIRPRRRTPTEATMGTVIEQRLDDCFKPSEAQRKYKVAMLENFHEKINYKPLESYTLEDMKKLCPSRHLEKWSCEPGFMDWLRNTRETKERLESLFNLALEAMEDILKNVDPKSQGARVQAIRICGELANKFSDRRNIQFIDKQVNALSKEELKAFIEAKAPSLLTQGNEADTVDVEEVESKKDS